MKDQEEVLAITRLVLQDFLENVGQEKLEKLKSFEMHWEWRGNNAGVGLVVPIIKADFND